MNYNELLGLLVKCHNNINVVRGRVQEASYNTLVEASGFLSQAQTMVHEAACQAKEDADLDKLDQRHPLMGMLNRLCRAAIAHSTADMPSTANALHYAINDILASFQLRPAHGVETLLDELVAMVRSGTDAQYQASRSKLLAAVSVEPQPGVTFDDALKAALDSHAAWQADPTDDETGKARMKRALATKDAVRLLHAGRDQPDTVAAALADLVAELTYGFQGAAGDVMSGTIRKVLTDAAERVRKAGVCRPGVIEALQRSFPDVLSTKIPVDPAAAKGLALGLAMRGEPELMEKLAAEEREQLKPDQRFRVGRQVPRNVYDRDVPLFVADSAERAKDLVALLNAGDAPGDLSQAVGRLIATARDYGSTMAGDPTATSTRRAREEELQATFNLMRAISRR